VGRRNSKPNIGSHYTHGHGGGTMTDQTWKTPKDLSVHDREERGCGEGVGLYPVYMSYDCCLLLNYKSIKRELSSMLFIMNR